MCIAGAEENIKNMYYMHLKSNVKSLVHFYHVKAKFVRKIIYLKMIR